MTVFEEDDIRITFPANSTPRKFDDESHGLSHCMKAVDFVVEESDRILFIEFKGPDHPCAKKTGQSPEEYLSDKLHESLKYKYRDTFLYEWACNRTEKKIYYLVLVASEKLSEAELAQETDKLRRNLPDEAGSKKGKWERPIVHGCTIFNIRTWNNLLPDYPVERVS